VAAIPLHPFIRAREPHIVRKLLRQQESDAGRRTDRRPRLDGPSLLLFRCHSPLRRVAPPAAAKPPVHAGRGLGTSTQLASTAWCACRLLAGFWRRSDLLPNPPSHSRSGKLGLNAPSTARPRRPLLDAKKGRSKSHLQRVQHRASVGGARRPTTRSSPGCSASARPARRNTSANSPSVRRNKDTRIYV